MDLNPVKSWIKNVEWIHNRVVSTSLWMRYTLNVRYIWTITFIINYYHYSKTKFNNTSHLIIICTTKGISDFGFWAAQPNVFWHYYYKRIISMGSLAYGSIHTSSTKLYIKISTLRIQYFPYFTENMCKLFDMYTQLKQWHIHRCYAHCTLFMWKYEEGDLVNSFAHVSSADIKWDCSWNENELHAWFKWENREHFLINRYFWNTF